MLLSDEAERRVHEAGQGQSLGANLGEQLETQPVDIKVRRM